MAFVLGISVCGAAAIFFWLIVMAGKTQFASSDDNEAGAPEGIISRQSDSAGPLLP